MNNSAFVCHGVMRRSPLKLSRCNRNLGNKACGTVV